MKTKKTTKDSAGIRFCWVERLFRSLLLESNDLHVASPLHTKYRNKITYNVPIREYSPLAQDNIQSVCRWVNDYITGHPDPSVGIQEIMVKATRKGEIMVRFTLQYGASPPPQVFLQALRSAFHGRVGVVCWNYEPSPGVRPTPSLAALETHDAAAADPKNMYLKETTPDGRHSYRLGPDTFSEVNPMVEAQQYAQTLAWLEDRHPSTHAKDTTLLVSGRDISVFSLGYGERFPHVIAIQHCPLVHRDALYNLGAQNSSGEKYTILHCPDKQEMGAKVTEVLNKKNLKIMGAVLTGGRKGLAPLYVDFLVHQQQEIQFIVYNSCSVDSLIRDMRGLLKGFYIQDVRRYDFFPGTKYVASLVYLVRRRRSGVLVLPIGPAGVGKSTLARTLLKMNGQKPASWWQRDQVYADLRNCGYGLARTRKQVHQELLQFLQGETNRDVLKILDSTNGNADARALYLMESDAECVVYVNFVTSDVDFLLSRTVNRLSPIGNGNAASTNNNHPSFPTTVDDQKVKHESILKGIEYANVHCDSKCRVVVLTVDPTTSNLDPTQIAYHVLAASYTTQRPLKALGIEGLEEVGFSYHATDDSPMEEERRKI